MMKLSFKNIKEAKNNLDYPSELFINGKYQKSISENVFDNISPIDGKLINKVSLAQKEDIDLSVLKQEKFLIRAIGLTYHQVKEKKFF